MRKSRAAFIIAAVVVGLLATTAASAVLTSRTGGYTDRQTFVTESTAWSTANARYTNVPGAAASVFVPSGSSRLVNVRFTAESACSGTVGWCTVRAILIYPTGAQLELYPASGTDFAFDTADPGPTDIWESHAIERSSPWLPPGTVEAPVPGRTASGRTLERLEGPGVSAGFESLGDARGRGKARHSKGGPRLQCVTR